MFNGGDAFTATVEGTPVSIDLAGGFEIFDGTSWIAASGVNLEGLPEVLFLIPEFVDTPTMWRVANPADWVFEDGQPLVAPFSGAF